jgi:hypothetical protein
LLLVSSSVSMSVPFTIGKLIDFFSSANPVRGPTMLFSLVLKLYSQYLWVLQFGKRLEFFCFYLLQERLQMQGGR